MSVAKKVLDQGRLEALAHQAGFFRVIKSHIIVLICF